MDETHYFPLAISIPLFRALYMPASLLGYEFCDPRLILFDDLLGTIGGIPIDDNVLDVPFRCSSTDSIAD